MFLPAILPTQIARPIPWTAALQTNGEEHRTKSRSAIHPRRLSDGRPFVADGIDQDDRSRPLGQRA